jgi:hypothetical protein
MIRFACPMCKTAYEVPDDAAGKKSTCRECGQKFRVPDLEAFPTREGFAAYQDDRPSRRRRRRDDEDDYDDRDDRDDRPSRRRGFRCPFCHTAAPPFVRKRISMGGWVLFVILLLACFPLCLFALLITEDYRVCSECGINLG